MKNIRTVTGKLILLNRLPSSYYGNPRYELTVFNREANEAVLITTPVDSTLGYSAPNFEGKEVTCEAGIHYGRLTLASIKEVKQASRVRLTVNKASIEIDALTDTRLPAGTFEELRARSGWNDTGGGWRWIFKKLMSMIKSYTVSLETTQEYKAEYECYLKVEKAGK